MGPFGVGRSSSCSVFGGHRAKVESSRSTTLTSWTSKREVSSFTRGTMAFALRSRRVFSLAQSLVAQRLVVPDRATRLHCDRGVTLISDSLSDDVVFNAFTSQLVFKGRAIECISAFLSSVRCLFGPFRQSP